MRARVFVPEALVHLISTRSPVCSLATLVVRSDGTLQVTPATVTVALFAPSVSAPCASTVSGLGDWQPPEVRMTALPPLVPPPSLPPVKPPADDQSTERFATSLLHGA